MKNSLIKLLVLPFLAATCLPAIASQEIDDVVAYSGISGSYLAARVATTDHDDEAAVSFLEKSLILDPDNNRTKRNLFHAYLAAGSIEKAVELAREIKEEDANGYVISMVNGVEFIRKRSWAKSIDTLSKVDGSDLDKLISGIVGGWALHGSGKTQEGLKLIDDIEGANWMDTLKQLHRGLIYSQAGNDEAAVKVLQKAVDTRAAARFLTEAYVDAIDALARAQQRLGKTDDARKTIAHGLKIFANHPALHAMNAALDEGKPAALLIANPQQGAAEFFYNLGNAIGREGGTPFALIYLQLAKHLYPESAAISISLAAIFEKQENPNRANEYYKQVDENSPFHRRALLEYAINLNTLKDVDGAVKLLNELIVGDPDDLVPYMAMGRLFNQLERYQEAADVFDRAIARIKKPEDKHWDYYYNRAISFERLKNWEMAEASFLKSLELSPDRVSSLNYLGYSWIDRGMHLDKALGMIKKAVKLRPDAGFIADSLGWAYYRLGRYDEAVVELEKAIVKSSMAWDPVVNDHLGDAYWKTGRKIEARFQWRHAIDAKPEPEDRVKILEKLKYGIVEAAEKPIAKSE